MSDQPTPPVSDPSQETPASPFDALLERYEAGVDAPADTSLDVNDWLKARSDLESSRSDLTEAQIDRLKVADATFVANASQIATRLSSVSTSEHPSSQWWWYPNVIAAASHAQDEVEEAPQGRFLNGSTLFTILEVVVLLIAVVLLAHNLGVVVIPPVPTPTATSAPTLVPTPAPTVDAKAFDITTAKVFTSDHDVFEIQLPAGWQSTAQIAPTGGSTFSFYAGTDPQSALASIQFQLTDAKSFYANLDPTGKIITPQAALQSIIDQNNSNAQPGATPIKFTAVTDVKVGSLTGKGLTAITPAGQQGPEAHYYVYFVPVDPGQILEVQARADSTAASLALPLFDKMLASVVVKPTNIPTATPTQTPLPLLLTATAFQSTLNALTPTATATPTSTSTPAITAVPGSGTQSATGPAVASTPVAFPDGLQYIDTVIGTGAAAKKGDTLSMKYTGKLANGTVFDSTDSHGGTPFDFQLGAGQVIPGWDEGLVGMKVGGKRTLIIPPALGYGAQGQGSIPPNSTLTFDVELVAIK